MVGGRRRLFIVNTGRVAVVYIFAQSQCRNKGSRGATRVVAKKTSAPLREIPNHSRGKGIF